MRTATWSLILFKNPCQGLMFSCNIPNIGGKSQPEMVRCESSSFNLVLNIQLKLE